MTKKCHYLLLAVLFPWFVASEEFERDDKIRHLSELLANLVRNL